METWFVGRFKKRKTSCVIAPSNCVRIFFSWRQATWSEHWRRVQASIPGSTSDARCPSETSCLPGAPPPEKGHYQGVPVRRVGGSHLCEHGTSCRCRPRRGGAAELSAPGATPLLLPTVTGPGGGHAWNWYNSTNWRHPNTFNDLKKNPQINKQQKEKDVVLLIGMWH